MKLSEIRAAIKAKNKSMNIAPPEPLAPPSPIPVAPPPTKPEIVKTGTVRKKKNANLIPPSPIENTEQNIEAEQAIATPVAPVEQSSTSPRKKESKPRTSKSKSANIQINEVKEEIEAIVSKYLRPNQDYAVIPNTKKPTLLKGGAEKLASIFGFNTSCSIVNRIEHFDYDTPANSFVQYEAKVIVYNRDGDAISEGYGSCNSSESKFLKQPFANRINTVLKISKKRAYVDAILTATCASSVFTQDMEDIANFQDSSN